MQNSQKGKRCCCFAGLLKAAAAFCGTPRFCLSIPVQGCRFKLISCTIWWSNIGRRRVPGASWLWSSPRRRPNLTCYWHQNSQHTASCLGLLGCVSLARKSTVWQKPSIGMSSCVGPHATAWRHSCSGRWMLLMLRYLDLGVNGTISTCRDISLLSRDEWKSVEGWKRY